MADVFVSYKAEDRPRVRPLVHCLQADGYSVWWDEHIGTGDAWRETIESELNRARCIIVVWSKRSVGSEGAFVREEAARAQHRGVYLPVLIDSVAPPLGFGEKQATSLKSWKGNCADPRYQTLLSSVRRFAADGTSASPGTGHLVSRRSVIAGGSIALVAAVGVGAWKLLLPSGAPTSKSIAVLPFTNLSGDPKQAYFSDGVAEQIRSALTRLGGLTVIGSSSSEAVRNEDAKAAATKLGVANILTGSVRQSPSTIRITAELIDGRTGADRWTQDYDRMPGDTIRIQTDIAENVAIALRGALGLAARAALTVGGTQNPEAQRLVLQFAQIDHFSSASLEHGLDLINQAIALDPNYADAYARKALVLALIVERFFPGSVEASAKIRDAEKAANRALELAPKLPTAHVARAGIFQARLQLIAAKMELERALALAPDDPIALADYAQFMATSGDPSQALRVSNRLIAIDPLSGRSYSVKAFVLFALRRYADAFAEEQLIMRKWPDRLVALLYAQVLMKLGRDNEATQWLARSDPASPIRLSLEGTLAARAGNLARANACKARLRALYGDMASFHSAQIDAELGRKDDAFAELDRAWSVKESSLGELSWNPWFDPLRSDPRYSALIRKIGFPEQRG